MGRILLVCRLATRDLRRRPVEAALLLLAITAATGTLTLGLVLHDTASDPYRKTRDATAGPDVVASISSGPEGGRVGGQALAGLTALARAPGVVGHSGPYPVTGAALAAHGQLATAQVEGRDPAAAAINRPKLTQGSWLNDGSAVIEAAFADALGVHAGDQITLNGRTFRVAGVAVTPPPPPPPPPSPPRPAGKRLSHPPAPPPP